MGKRKVVVLLHKTSQNQDHTKMTLHKLHLYKMQLTLIEAFGGKGYIVATPDELKYALTESYAAQKPAVINVITQICS
ncbi:Oxalyl-CoA decarboxylase protein [Dioscorea alata]|uniref:Oxalyl-CoA decarboxylase protein n=1 Tax=Dioscorea alata TaxID=55571 RepID=A0ACB7WK75_DIOAL|nr:Oxalyl-CoA decarboxylase protein [Dioscorea alata]